jgi:hypothetical protein
MAPRQGLVYGVGALRAAARGDRALWALHRAALVHGLVPVVPALVVADGFRTEARSARLESFLAGTEMEVLTPAMARHTGELAARADTTDLAAVAVVEAADRCRDAVVAGRQPSLRAVAALLNHDLVQQTV